MWVFRELVKVGNDDKTGGVLTIGTSYYNIDGWFYYPCLAKLAMELSKN